MSDLVMNNLYTGFAKGKKQYGVNLRFILKYNFIQIGSESYELPSYSLIKRPLKIISCACKTTTSLQAF